MWNANTTNATHLEILYEGIVSGTGATESQIRFELSGSSESGRPTWTRPTESGTFRHVLHLTGEQLNNARRGAPLPNAIGDTSGVISLGAIPSTASLQITNVIIRPVRVTPGTGSGEETTRHEQRPSPTDHDYGIEVSPPRQGNNNAGGSPEVTITDGETSLGELNPTSGSNLRTVVTAITPDQINIIHSALPVKQEPPIGGGVGVPVGPGGALNTDTIRRMR
jgi:hypothetical protein